MAPLSLTTGTKFPRFQKMEREGWLYDWYNQVCISPKGRVCQKIGGPFLGQISWEDHEHAKLIVANKHKTPVEFDTSSTTKEPQVANAATVIKVSQHTLKKGNTKVVVNLIKIS